MPDPTNTPTALDNEREAARGATALVNVQLPATVVRYDPVTQQVEVKIVPCFRRKDATQGNAVVCYDPPPIPNIPVAFPGAGGISITWPLAVGDIGLLTICDRSIDEWKSTAADRTTPEDPRRHNLADGVFIPGLRSPAVPLTGDAVDPTGLVLTAPKVVINSADTRLGSNAASDPVSLESKVDGELQALASVFDTWISVPNDGGAALKTLLTTLLLTWPGLTGATKVRAE